MAFRAVDQRGLFRVRDNVYEHWNRHRRAFVENRFMALDPEGRPRVIEDFRPGLLVPAIVGDHDMPGHRLCEFTAYDFDVLAVALKEFDGYAVNLFGGRIPIAAPQPFGGRPDEPGSDIARLDEGDAHLDRKALVRRCRQARGFEIDARERLHVS